MSKMTKINREELKTLIAQRSGLSKEKTDIFLDAFTDVVKETMVEGKVIHIMGFGDFFVRERAARKCANPRTQEIMAVPKCKVPTFKPSQVLKVAVNEV